MSVETEGYDPHRDIDVEQLIEDTLNVTNGIIDSPDDFGDTPLINAGKFLEIINDKIYGYYKTGCFAPERDDFYFMDVLDRELEIYGNRINNIS